MGRLMGLSWISSTLGMFRNRTLRFKFAQFPRYPNFATLNTYGNPPNPLLGFASQGSTTLQIPLNKILGSKSHRVFYGAPDGDCLARSRLTAISCFAFWTLSNRKNTPASAHSRSNPQMGSHPHHSNKKDLDKSQSLFYGAPDGIRTHAYRNHNPRS